MKQEFKTIGSMLAMSAMILFAASCAKEELSEEAQKLNPGIETTINANAGLPNDATNNKAFLDPSSNYKVKWESGDALNINGSSITECGIAAGSTSAQFSGTTHAIESGSDYIYWAVYPTNIAGTYNGNIPANFTENTLKVNFASKQVYDLAASHKMADYNYMAAYTVVPAGTEDVKFQMRNLGSILCIRLKADNSATNKQAEKIVFTSNDKLLSGAFTSNNTFTALSGSESECVNYVTVQLKNGSNNYIDITTEKMVFVVLPPMAGKQLSMRIYNTDGSYTIKNTSSATLARNYVYTVNMTDTKFESNPYYVAGVGDTVVFSPGNLQWSATNGGSSYTTHRTTDGTAEGTWRFASKQWRHIYEGNLNISATYSGWIDLFGWATSGWHATHDTYVKYYMPYNDEQVIVDRAWNTYGYGPSKGQARDLTGGSKKYDWGEFNEIVNTKTGNTDAPGTWRTPTAAEWDYLLFHRATATKAGSTNNARFTMVALDTNSSHGYTYNSGTSTRGLILFPDNGGTFIMNGTGSLGSVNDSSRTKTFTTLSYSDWVDWEKMGATFLPAAGIRRHDANGSGPIIIENHHGFYWSSTHLDDDDTGNAIDLYFGPNSGNHINIDYAFKAAGRSVRLVKKYVR